jgi:hypothetical protein
MQSKRSALLIILAGLSFVVAAAVFLATAGPARAQCGSQASSCKNCHEVQGKDPVNADGTAWHQSHAFGDFCYICHAGNQQATDETAAHQGMEDPLSDVKAACQQCHASDLDARAKVYADALGVAVGTGAASSAAATPAPTASTGEQPASAAGSTTSNCNGVVVNDPNAVDYAANYDAIVLGKQPVNWGNMILIGMIGLLVVGGGGYVITHEKLVNVKFGDTRQAEGEYPADVVEMLPKIAGLKPGARKSLGKVLENPQKADKLLDLMDAVISEEKKEEE